MQSAPSDQTIEILVSTRSAESRIHYLLSDVVTFSRIRDRERSASTTTTLVGPLLQFDVAGPSGLEPHFDLNGKSPRFAHEDGLHDWYPIRVKQLAFASAAHLFVALGVGLVSLLVGGRLFRMPAEMQVIPVEMVFGISEEQQSRAPAPSESVAQSTPEEATKSPDQLPQLPKVLSVESVERPPDTLPVPVTPAAAPTAAATPVLAEATPEPGTRILKAEELLKRLERERRAVAKKTREGVQEKSGKGAKNAKTDLPPNPLAGVVPATPGALPAGVLSGTLTGPAQAYQLAAQRHVKRQWSLPDVVRFDSELLTQVEVTLSLFGKIVEARLVKTSGNDDFDKEVLEAIERSNPFPDFSNEGISKRVLVLSFRPREVK